MRECGIIIHQHWERVSEVLKSCCKQWDMDSIISIKHSYPRCTGQSADGTHLLAEWGGATFQCFCFFFLASH